MTFELFEVGGCIRDELLGATTKDIDFTVVGPKSHAEMRAELVKRGFKIHTEDEFHGTIRCGVPASMKELRAIAKDADFVLARHESSESDGRHPDKIEAGTLEDDLSRRDFTINALARPVGTMLKGEIIDLFGGLDDLEHSRLRFVGDPMTRIREDALRVIRGFRFMLTKDLFATKETQEALFSEEAADLLSAFHGTKRVVSVERIQGELDRMFRASTLDTLDFLSRMPEHTRDALFPDPIRLCATLSQA